MTRRGVVLVAVLLGQVSWGQDARVPLAPFPLELKSVPKAATEKQKSALARELRRVVATVCETPNVLTIEDALRAIKRQDCDRDDECLQQFATASKSLYALYAAVEVSADEKRVTVLGRVVRDDKMIMGAVERVERTRAPKESFEDAAKKAIAELVDRLVVRAKLPAVRPVELKPQPAVVEPTPPVAVVQPVATVSPPPVVIVQPVAPPPDSSMRTAGYIGLGVGGVAVVGGAISFASAPVIRKEGDLVVREDAGKFQQAQLQQGLGVGLLIGGALVAGTGALLMFLAPQAPVHVSAWVQPGQGGAVTVGGAF